MPSNMYLRLQSELKQAMLAHDEMRRDTIRLIIAACKFQSVSLEGELSDDDIVGILVKEKKVRQQSIEEYRLGGRLDLCDREDREMQVISTFLPQQLSLEEIEIAVRVAVKETGALTIKDMGRVMALLSPLKGKADMQIVSAKVKQILS